MTIARLPTRRRSGPCPCCSGRSTHEVIEDGRRVAVGCVWFCCRFVQVVRG